MSKKNGRQSERRTHQDRRPNFLFFVVDEERFQSAYENKELKRWRRNNLKTQELLSENGITFLNHYIGSTACSPSRATLFTGQYPSLHGVTQTTGVAKGAFDPDTYWLDPNTVPTLGDYFRAAGYRTFWKGKWHISDEDILIPGTHNALTTYDKDGFPDPIREQKYLKANRLDPFGFSGWVGPEPHGSDPLNSASSAADGVGGRDVVYSREVVNLLSYLEKDAQQDNDKPWLIVSSFVDPHDITLFGLFSQLDPSFNFKIDPSVPSIPPAPTSNESLDTKPTAQASYREIYQKAFQPTRDSHFFRQLYFSLQKKVDGEMFKVFQALKQSVFYENTIVVFTSDHGDLLGAHGGLFQKWHNTYEETIHVPLIIHHPKRISGRKDTEMLTSHVDVIPTLLGLADINIDKVQKKLRKDHTEVHPFVGRDLCPLFHEKFEFQRSAEPLYFMTDDEVTKGLNQVSLTGKPYDSVIQPNHLESIIIKLRTGENEEEEIWKYTRYFDNPQFWSNPGIEDETIRQHSIENMEASICVTTSKTEPVKDQFELYNVTKDPYEEKNLAHPSYATPETKIIQRNLEKTLKQQSQQKRLYPTSGDTQGIFNNSL